MAATVIEIDVMQIGEREFVTVQDAARYLRVSDSSVDYFAYRGRMKIEIVESRKLLDWETVQTFSRGLRGERQMDYEVRIVRPALPQV